MPRGFYSLPEPRIFRGRSRRTETSGPDAYSPRSPDYAERHKETATEIAHGMIRVDIGAPIKRLASEPQPVPIVQLELPSEGQPDRVPAPEPLYAPRSFSSVASPENWRNDYGLRKSS